MDLILLVVGLGAVIWLYFANNPLKQSKRFVLRRFVTWFPLGMSYAFLYMGRYNLNVSKNALGSLMTKEDFGIIFGVGTCVYALSFLISGPMVDRIGGKRGILIATIGASVANAGMGLVTWLLLHNALTIHPLLAFCLLYAANMYFQSFGSVSINKIKAYWFHVRERGLFGAIFGVPISFGVYFAFDWSQTIVDATRVNPTAPLTPMQTTLRSVFALDGATADPTWLVFFIPAVILIFWALLDVWCIKDSPQKAGFEDFDVADASSDEMDREYTTWGLIGKVFTSPILLTIAGIEFAAGVVRNGIMQWYLIFAKETGQTGGEIFSHNWGLWLCFSGIFGSFAVGFISDKLFHSRRGPPAVHMNLIMFVLVIVMAIFLYSAPIVVGIAAVIVTFAVIGVHGIMSGTAAADFGGRKATATCAGIIDGFVYLGSGLQSFCLGYITTWSWRAWPAFLIPFTLVGLYFSLKMWRQLPNATKRYLRDVEKVSTADEPSLQQQS